MTSIPAAVTAWHAIFESHDPAQLPAILADEVVFRSPALHKPQEGRALTTAYLAAAMVVLGPKLRYVNEWYGPDSAVLQFETELDGLTVHGVDIIRWNADDRLTEFTGMIRPMRALQAVITHMSDQLTAGQPGPQR
jgi:hypothetical protein